MKKLLFTATLLAGLLSFENLNAQKLNVGAHFSTGLPIGDFSESNNFGLGGGISLDYYFNDQWNIGIEGEFLAFPSAIDDLDYTSTIIPIQLTGAYHVDIDDVMDFYAGTGVGLFMLGSNLEDSETSSEFGVSPRIGVAFELTPELFLDFNVRYSLIFNGETIEGPSGDIEVDNTSYIGFNLGLLYTIQEY